MPFGGLISGIFGGSKSKSNNDVGIEVNSAPVINIELDALSDAVDDLGGQFKGFTATVGFVALVAILATSLGGRS